MKMKITATTDHGVFTRTTAREYTHVALHFSRGKVQRVTWHMTEDAAIKAGRSPWYGKKAEDKKYLVVEVDKPRREKE